MYVLNSDNETNIRMPAIHIKKLNIGGNLEVSQVNIQYYIIVANFL